MVEEENFYAKEYIIDVERFGTIGFIVIIFVIGGVFLLVLTVIILVAL